MLKYVTVGIKHEGETWEAVFRADGKGGVVKNPQERQPKQRILCLNASPEEVLECLEGYGVPTPALPDVLKLLAG